MGIERKVGRVLGIIEQGNGNEEQRSVFREGKEEGFRWTWFSLDLVLVESGQVR
jgi:hypothetical protein